MLKYEREDFGELTDEDYAITRKERLSYEEREMRLIERRMKKRFPEWDKRRMMFNYIREKRIRIYEIGKRLGIGYRETVKEMFRGISIEFSEAIKDITGDDLGYLVQLRTSTGKEESSSGKEKREG